MTPSEDIYAQIAPHLPFLRRFARAMAGGQAAGDAIAAATLERIIINRMLPGVGRKPRVALYRVFYQVWTDLGTSADATCQETSPMAVRAQERLRALAPAERIALLLNGLEGFDPVEVAAIMDTGEDRARELIAAGRADLLRQAGGRALIIEDEPMIAMDIETIVTELGHAVTDIVDTHAKAVNAVLRDSPNVVLADIRLADGSSGIDAADEILSLTSVPVIFVTAFPELLLTGARAEPTFLIPKPFEREELETVVGQALLFGDAASA